MRPFLAIILLTSTGCENESPPVVRDAANIKPQIMTLEDQLAKLEGCGIALNDGVTVDDVLYSFDRSAYEEKPFDLLLFILGAEVEREPWGRPFCSRVWNFDTECIYQTGDYVKIVKRLCMVAGNPDLITDITDSVNLESGEAWLKYKVDGQSRDWSIEVNDDWADTLTLSYVMDDIERDGYRFYAKDNGQAQVFYYLDTKTAEDINSLSDNALKAVLPE